ncbi:hypothetical protein DPMN_044398 [Dreissena polymorpha]|uniref:Uncharacterized protein n=1 Tax=Dreissena polymorpha TaxID=45954 RepID=A0A9D4D2B6_DREPO|nr:hypothetical protein DPMN_044398 [Dreissena polymorpha]
MSDEVSRKPNDADGHTGGLPEPLNLDAKFTKTEGSINVKRIDESQQTGNNAMTATKIDPTECNVVTAIVPTQEENSPKDSNPTRGSQTDENCFIKLPDIPV